MIDAAKKQPGAARSSRTGGAPASETEASEPEKIVRVLAISPHEDDHRFLQSIFSHSNWQLRGVRNWREARSFLGSHPMPVVISESELPDASWREVLAELFHLPDRPVLIVSSRTADEYLWAEVLNLGGYDVLAKPFDSTEVFRVVSLAWLNWKNSREHVRAARGGELSRAAGQVAIPARPAA